MNPPNHPPTHQTIHPPMGGEVSTDFKSSNRIEISRLVQVLLNFDWFWGSPPGGGWIGVRVVRRCPHTCTCTHVHAWMCIWHHREFPGIPQWGLPFACEIIMFTMHACACVCMHACACMCMCVGGTSHTSPTLIYPPTPHLQSHREPKTPKFNKTWTNWDNSILFEDSLPLNIPELISTIVDHPDTPHPPAPPPRAEETQIRRITITL